MVRNARQVRQHQLAFRNWGGARRGAGRKPSGDRPRVSHSARPALAARHPVHVTVRAKAGLPSLRRDASRRALERVIACASDRLGARVVHYSIQSNHVHFVIEAASRVALSRAMLGLQVRLARALNELWRRAGAVLADRYHARILSTPREVRNALVYVLHNARHHGLRVVGVDPFSSGAWFDGWRELAARATRASPCATAATWLLSVGWCRAGYIGVAESPVIVARRV